MTFKELLNSVSFGEVAPELVRMYPKAEHDLRWYKIHFDMLRLMTPKRHEDSNGDVCQRQQAAISALVALTSGAIMISFVSECSHQSPSI